MANDKDRWQDGIYILSDLPDKDVADLLGVTYEAVRLKRHRIGAIPPNTRYKDFVDWDDYDDLLWLPLSDYQMAEIMGCSHTLVKRRRHKLGIPIAREILRQEREKMIEVLRKMDPSLEMVPDKDIFRKALEGKSIAEVVDMMADDNYDIPDYQYKLTQIVGARIAELFKRTETGESEQGWRDMELQLQKMRFALEREDVEKALEIHDKMVDLTDQGQNDYLLWREISAWMDQFMKFGDSDWERRMDMNTILTYNQVQIIFSAMLDSVRNNVRDEEVLRRIESDFRDAMNMTIKDLKRRSR